jgi:hypothetical protein
MTSFLMTWKEAGWPHENIVQMVKQREQQGYVEEPWRIAAHKRAKPGDRVWVLRQGRGPKGIFGAGHITGAPVLGPAGNGKMQMMAPVRFESFVDPYKVLLIGEDVVAGILGPTQIGARASGYPMTDEQSVAFEALLTSGGPGAKPNGGGDWTEGELHSIVGAYFAMLEDERSGRPYSKTEHRNTLRKVVQRSPGSIERKHQNISAVLQELELPWINGYKPLGNYQEALAEVVEAHLDGMIERLDSDPAIAAQPPSNVSSLFVPPPPPSSSQKNPPTTRVSKYDQAARDAANRSLGKAGEKYVVQLEQVRLKELGRKDLADKVAWVSDSLGDGLGYDIRSFAGDGSPIFIEVKTTRGPITTAFHVTENERRVATRIGATFRIYRLFGFGTSPKVYTLAGPLEDAVTLEPIAYRARVGPPP